MSEEEQGPVYIDDTQNPSEVRIPYPFIVTDAALSTFLAEMGNEMRFRSRWRQTSSGSAYYTLTTATNRRLGELVVRAIDERETYVKAITTSPLPEYLPWLLARFAWWIVTDILTIKARTTESPTPPGPAPGPLESASKRTSREPPARNAPIDDWLDWREDQLQRGRGPHSVSFRKLSEQSVYSEDQLSRRSRARQKSR